MTVLQDSLLKPFEKIKEKILYIKGSVFIIADQTVWDLYGVTFRDLDVPVFLLPSGEQSKTQTQKWAMEQWLFSHGCRRSSVLISLGGGVASDIVGFVASTFMRGISWIACPTTLLALVDASIGGKNGINTPFGKNTLGTFHSPIDIWRDLAFLQTLPVGELQNGFAEICKYALVGSTYLFDLLQRNLFTGNFLFPPNMEEIVRASIQCKERIVSEDYRESTGVRSILNFGHTLGHAIESLSDYQIPHGEAVFWGMLFSVYLSYEKGFLPLEAKNLAIDLLDGYRNKNCPYPLADIPPQKVYALLQQDKKNNHSSPSFILLQNIGQPYSSDGSFCTKISFKEFEKVLMWLATV